MSVELLVWHPGAWGGATTFFFGNPDSGTGSGIFLALTATNQLQCNYSTVGIIDAVAFPLRQWVHVVATHDGANLRLYKNAVLVNTAAVAAVAATTALVLIGRRNGGGNISNAWISEVAIYNAALSAARINAHFLALNNVPSNPVKQTPAIPIGSNGGVIPVSTDVSSILSAVQKTFPTT